MDITCPDCRGPLKQYRFGAIAEFRCIVGHAHSALSLANAHQEAQDFSGAQESKRCKGRKHRRLGNRLALRSQLAERNAGSVAVDSPLGRGTTVVIDMPTDARPFQNAQTLG